MSETLTSEDSKEQYDELLDQIKKEYKPRLKQLPKNKLIEMVIELSTHISIFREYEKTGEQK